MLTAEEARSGSARARTPRTAGTGRPRRRPSRRTPPGSRTPSQPSSAILRVQLLVVGLAPVVGERVALLARAALALGEVADRLDERALLVGQGLDHRGLLERNWQGANNALCHAAAVTRVRDAVMVRMVRICYSAYHHDVRRRDDAVPHRARDPGLLVGPDSVTWRFASDARLYCVMLYPLLLQVAHPVVGAGVRDYSDFEQRPWNRLMRTIDYVTVLVYGGADAVAMGRRLRDLHKGFQGVREDGTARTTRSSPRRTPGCTRRCSRPTSPATRISARPMTAGPDRPLLPRVPAASAG